MEANKYAKLCLDWTKTMFVINKTLQQITNYENNHKYSQKPKFQGKSARRNCRSHLHHELYPEKFIYGL